MTRVRWSYAYEIVRWTMFIVCLSRKADWFPGIEFGTAGLRGRMAAGFSCMNSLIVIQASQGLAKYIRTQRPEIAAKGVVIGYDARHNSRRFAELAANAFFSLQIPVYFFSQSSPTPLVPFGINYFKAAAGIMVTASHVCQ